jgi:hypothetical protein
VPKTTAGPVGVGVAVGAQLAQLAAQSCAATLAHTESQAVMQQKTSTPHTHAWQVASSQPVPAWAVQQSPPGVGVGV